MHRSKFDLVNTIALISTLWLALWLRVYKLSGRALWWDEAWSAWISRYDIGGILHRSATDVHPPFYMLMLHGWRGLIGESAWSLRLFSALFGVLCVVATYKLAQSISKSRWPILFAPLLVAISRLHITWSQEVRMYTLSTFCATLALYAAAQIWKRETPSSFIPHHSYALFLIASLIGLHTHYLFTFVLIAINVAWLWMLVRGRWQASLRWIGLQIAIVLLWLPWLTYWLSRSRSWSAASSIDLTTFFNIQWTVYTVGIPAGIEQFSRWTIPLFGLLIVGVVGLIVQARGKWTRLRELSLLIAGSILPAILLFLLLLPGRNFLYTPPVAPRYFILFVGAYSVLLAWALTDGVSETLRRFKTFARLLSSICALFAISIALMGLRPYYPNRVEKDVYQSLANTIHAHQHENDAIVLFTDFDWPTFDFYVGEGWYGIPSSWVLDEAQVEAYLRPIWDTHDAIWVATTPHALQTDSAGLLPAWLSDRAIHTTDYQFGDQRLTLYEKVAHDRTFTPPSFPNPTYIYFEHALDLYESGDQIHLFVDLLKTTGEFSHVVLNKIETDMVWQEVALPATAETDRFQQHRYHIPITVPPEAPDGTYRLTLVGRNRDPMPHATLGTVTIRQRKREIVTLDQVDIDQPLTAEFDDGITLLGYELGEIDETAQGVPLTLYWNARQPVSQRYKVFTHLLGDVWNGENGNFLWGQQDNEPVNNRRQTTLWRTDEVIVDPYNIPFAENRPPGRYQIEVGLYDPTTGTRLLLKNGDDHLILTTITLTDQ